MKPSMAVAYGMKKKASKQPEEHMSKMDDDQSLHKFMAHGGDIVDHIISKKYSQGGMVANGGEDELSHLADGMPNNFDDLALDDDLESTNSGESSGDFLGNAQEDEDRHDIVARVMKSRAKKDKMPRPA